VIAAVQWSADDIALADAVALRDVPAAKVLCRSRRIDSTGLPDLIRTAERHIRMRTNLEMPPGSLGNGEAAERVARMIEAGAGDGLREHLIYFAIRVGARRLSDTADCLLLAGYTEAAEIAARQARLVGSLQHPMATGALPPAAAALRELAPTYDRLRAALA
jgi:hypothetical protein